MIPVGQLIEIDREDFERWIGPVSAVGATLLVFLLGAVVVRWRRRSAPASASALPSSKPKSDKVTKGADEIFSHPSKKTTTGADEIFSSKKAPAVGTEDIFTHGSKTERRGSLRRAGNPIAVFISDAEARSTPTTGYVTDRSTGGMCLSVSEAVTTGTIISVRTSNAPESIPWIQIEVKSCRANAGEFELGCQFVKTPPWSVMLLFG